MSSTSLWAREGARVVPSVFTRGPWDPGLLHGGAVGALLAEVGQEAVATPEEMRDRIEAAEQAGRNSILMLVRRDGQPRFVALNLSN